MEDRPSENSGLGSVLKESADYSIPKINMKFDGSTWKKNSEKEAEQNKDSTTMDSSSTADTNMQDSSHQDATPGTSTTTPQSTSSATYNPNQTSPASSLSTDDVDGEFEPSVDAMVHDFDDESTLEEEEEEDEEDSDELDDLTREGEMPLEELLAMYSAKPDSQSQEEEREESPAVETEAEERRENQDRIRKLRSNTTFLSPPHPHPDSDEDGDCDGDYAPPPEDWKKPPRVGEDYQVDSIPELKKQDADYDDETDKLVWDPEKVDMDKVEDYLSMVSLPSTTDPFMIPVGGHLRDNEDALFLLTQCDNDTDEALRRFKWRPRSLANEMHVWSEEECRQFELGLSLYGKDFHAIHHNKVKTKAIGDIVKFYYIWKKTERYDNFNAKTRLGKKKDSLHPGVTDYMERLLDETEHSLSAGMGGSGSSGATSATQAPLTHSAALQQHLIDLRVTRSHARHRPNNHYPDSPNTDYSEMTGFSQSDCQKNEMNGLLDSDFADDPAMFANIQPMPHSAPHLGNISPSVPFTEPPINVGYSDPGNFAPVASTVVTACNNNNNTDEATRHFQAAEVDPSQICPTSSERGFRPLDPAEITPALQGDQAAATVRRTTPLLQDVLSSIDELESNYPSQATSTSKTLQGITSSSQLPHHPSSSSDHLLPKRSRLSSPHPQEEQRIKEDAPSNIQRPSTTMTSSTTGGNSPDFGGRKSPTSSSGKIPDAQQLISC